MTVFAIWLPILAGDSRSAWDGHVLDDPRVVSLWDGEQVAGRWFGDHPLGGVGRSGDVVWDAYFAFRAGSRWRTTPTGLVAAGSDIIDNTEGLDDRFAAALAGP